MLRDVNEFLDNFIYIDVEPTYGSFIDHSPTEEQSKPAPDGNVSLSAMVAELAGAQGDLSASISELHSIPNADPSLLAQADQQLGLILTLKGQLATSGPKQLAAMSAQIAAVVQSATALVRQAEQATAISNSGGSSLSSASQAARAAVTDFEDDYFKKRKFEPYLHFASPEDERAYREREKEREKEIEQAKALGTPEGNKRAADLSIEQLHDAGEHGASESPDYAPDYQKLTEARAALVAEMAKSKPKEAAMDKPAADPLDSVEPSTASIPSELLAKFKAAGVVIADQGGSGHGVNVDLGANQDRGSRVPL